MILEKAVQRLRWRFSNNSSFKPNEKDIQALNSILEWISSQKEISVLNQGLFAKLYIMELNRNLRTFEATIFDDIPQKELSKTLNYPLDAFYKSFHNDLHHNQLVKLFKNKDKKDINIDDLKDKYTLEIVTDKLNHMISEAVNRFM